MVITCKETTITPLSQFQFSEEDRARTVTFTGHRPRKLCKDLPSRAAYDKATYKPHFMKQLRTAINDQIKAGYRNFISGGAQGFDQLAFWAVESLKSHYQKADPSIRIQNIVFVPVLHQESRWAEKGSFSQEEYRLMLKKADQVVAVSSHPYRKELGSKQMNERNKAMVDHAGLLIACINDLSSGTSHAVNYAASDGINVRTLMFHPAADHNGRLTFLKTERNPYLSKTGLKQGKDRMEPFRPDQQNSQNLISNPGIRNRDYDYSVSDCLIAPDPERKSACELCAVF